MAEPKHDLAKRLARAAARRRVVSAALLLASCSAAGCLLSRGEGPDGPVISWRQAAKHVDEFVTVEGRIVRTHNSGKACFLNFHPNWRQTFSAVIFASSFGDFPPKPEEHYRGKRVRLKGVVVEYQGRPEMILDGPDQIEILP